MRDAGIDRHATVICNVVPRWNGTTRIATDEIDALFGLPTPRRASTVCRRAEHAAGRPGKHGLGLMASAPSSPQVRAA
jgi:hypothetical protein